MVRELKILPLKPPRKPPQNFVASRFWTREMDRGRYVAHVTYQLHETAGELLKVTSFRIALAEVARPRFNRFRPEEQKTPNSISKQM